MQRSAIEKIKDPIFSLQDLKLLNLNIYPYQLSNWTKKGYLIKTRGGAVVSNNRNLVRLVEKTIHEYEHEKDMIARTAAKLVKPGMRIIIDSGSTTSFLLRYLKDMNLTVITNSLIAVHELSGLQNINLIVSGGSLRHESQSLIGIPSLGFFTTINADILFLGATGFSLTKGASASNIMEAETKKMMISSSEDVYLLIDSSKFGINSLSKICDASDLTGIITNQISHKLMNQCKSHDILVLQSLPETYHE